MDSTWALGFTGYRGFRAPALVQKSCPALATAETNAMQPESPQAKSQASSWPEPWYLLALSEMGLQYRP